MVIIMFNDGFSGLDLFESYFNAFMGNFAVTSTAEDGEWILRTFNSVEEDYYDMEEAAKKIMDDPKCAKIVRKTYNRRDFWKCVKAAESCGVELKIPSFI